MTLSLAAMTSAVGSLAWTSWITLLNRSVPPARNTSVWTPYFSVNPLVISSISSGRPLVYTRTGSPLAFARSASSSSRSGEGSMASSAALGDPDAVCPGQPLAGAADGAAASCVAVASAVAGCVAGDCAAVGAAPSVSPVSPACPQAATSMNTNNAGTADRRPTCMGSPQSSAGALLNRVFKPGDARSSHNGCQSASKHRWCPGAAGVRKNPRIIVQGLVSPCGRTPRHAAASWCTPRRRRRHGPAWPREERCHHGNCDVVHGGQGVSRPGPVPLTAVAGRGRVRTAAGPAPGHRAPHAGLAGAGRRPGGDPEGPVPPLSLIHISDPTRRTPISYAVF